jgi:hypothetical protein
MTHLPFATTATFSPEEAEIRTWLKANRASLEGMDASEVAYLAVTCGFDIADVCMTLSTFRDAMQGSHIDNRAAFEAWRFDMAVLDFAKVRKNLERVPELDLSTQWKELVANTVTGQAEAA